MSREKSLIRWISLTVVALLTTEPLLHAGSRENLSPASSSAPSADSVPAAAPAIAPSPAPAKDSHNYKTVQIKSGGKDMTVRVQEQANPLKNVNFNDDLDSHRAFSATNEMAHKNFSASAGAGWDKSVDLKDPDAFGAKPYSFDDAAPTAPNLGTKANFRQPPVTGGAASGFDKNFSTSTADASQNQTASLGAGTSPDQNRTAQAGGGKIDEFASALSNETFDGPEAEAAHRRLKQLGKGQIEIDIPDRPMSIDEVRNLINHGFKPNTSAPPPEPTKAMNDPNYVPQPLRDDPSAGRVDPPKARDDDKDDAVPPPGTLALPPENSEALPKR